MSSHKKLVDHLKDAAPAERDGAFAPDVMRRVRTRRPMRVQPGWFVAAGVSLAAVLFALRPHADAPAFTARGRIAPVSDLGVHAFAHGTELRAGEVVAPDTPLTFSVDHPSATAFMLFAIDAQHEVQWFYPEYRDAQDDPEPATLAGPEREALPEGVVLARPSAGALTIVALFGDPSLRVHAVEAALRTTPMATAFPHATLRTLSLVVDGGSQ